LILSPVTTKIYTLASQLAFSFLGRPYISNVQLMSVASRLTSQDQQQKTNAQRQPAQPTYPDRRILQLTT